MKAVMVNLIFFILATQTFINGQISSFEIEHRDTNYLEQVIYEKWDSTDIWNFKDHLKKGRYFVVSTNECGKDTLMMGEFLEDGVKHGKWIKWDERICSGLIGDDSTVSDWAFFGEPELREITIYEKGFIKKSTTYHIITNNPHIEHFYPKGATKLNEWIKERVWDGDDNLRWEKRLKKNGKMEHIDFYENGEIRSKGELESYGTFQKEWEYFYPNGVMMAKGKFEEFGKRKVRYYAGHRIPKAAWKYWDEEGVLIGVVTFKEGEVLSYKKYKNKEIPFGEIEAMINSK